MPHVHHAARVVALLAVLASASRACGQTPSGDQLPETQPLQLAEPLDVVMVRGINRFAERELAASRERRAAKWQRDYSSEAAYLQSIEPHRQRLREMIGAVDELSVPLVSIPHPDPTDLLTREVGIDDSAIRWDIVEGVTMEGRWLLPTCWDAEGRGQPLPVRAFVVVVPDPQLTPESLCGMDRTLTKETQLALRLAESGCMVLVLSPIHRECTLSGHPDIRFTNLSHREFVYRCGFELGRHPLGYEVQAALQARVVFRHFLYFWSMTSVDRDPNELPLGIAGVGDGGLVAMCAAALDTEFDACYVAGYFDERESMWKQPIDRNVFGLLTEFGDADIASLIAPRSLTIDRAAPPLVDGPMQVTERHPFAAPGTIEAPRADAVAREFNRVWTHYRELHCSDRIQLSEPTVGEQPICTSRGLQSFLSELGCQLANVSAYNHPASDYAAYDAARQKRLVESLVRHTQMVLHRSDKVREKFWKDADRSSVEKWVETSQKYRDYVHDTFIGRLPLPTVPLNPRSRKVIDEPTHTGWEVVLDVYPGESSVEGRVSSADSDAGTLDTQHSTLVPGVIAGGVLLLPKDLQPGERRPVVVCQHGLEGTPQDTITTDPTTRAWAAYKGFSTQLVQRGFIVYAPQNPYKGEDEFRVIQRKSNPLGRTLFSYIIEQHRQTLRWLATLPYVDPERIAFYGLSYGGKTAMRVPPLLDGRWSMIDGQWTDTTQVPSSVDHQPLTKYCLAICSADFNEWIRKNASAEDRYSYVYTKEYEIFEWNMGHIAGYAELASLMAPRPFMVERGHGDGVAPDEWVGWEFAKVRRHYDLLGIGDRAEIEWFNGPHTIHGQGTFRFLHKHLNWPEPSSSAPP